MAETKIVRLNKDAHAALRILKDKLEKIGEDRSAYSMSDVVIVSSVLMTILLEDSPEIAKRMMEDAKRLRLKKYRGEFHDSLLRALTAKYAPELQVQKGQGKLMEEIISGLINEGHLETAANLLVKYKYLIDEDRAKDLSAKILTRIKESEEKSLQRE